MLPRHSLRATLALNLVLLFPGLALLSRTSRPAPAAVRPPLHLQWVSEQPPLEPAWPDQPRFTSDSAFRPVPAGDVVLVTSSRTDSLTALDAVTGQRRWQFVAGGPVRFAPAVWDGRAFVTADDGYLYCLDVATGRPQWKFRGGPADRRILGNERLISSWPARGGPAVAVDGDRATVYFAAGIWPFMGVFLHAVDARTGEVRWTNGGDGSTFIKQPHQADSFAGLAPQGCIVIVGDRLLVPGGRSVPACYDRHTGRRLHYRLADTSKLGGGPDVVVVGDIYINGGGGFSLASGGHRGPVVEPVAAHGTILFSASATACRAFDVSARPPPPPKVDKEKDKDKDKKKKVKVTTEAWLGKPAASVAVPRTTTLLYADDRLFGGGDGVVYALDLPLGKTRSVSWRAAIEGKAAQLAFADGTLYVSTRQGRLYAFGPRRVTPRLHRLAEPTPLPAAEGALVQRVLKATSVRDGYAVVWGAGNGRLVAELLRRTQLRLIVVESDAAQAEALRRRLHEAHIDGKRASVLTATPATADLPPYLSALMVAEAPGGADFLDIAFRSLRPYGGAACFVLPPERRGEFKAWLASQPQATADAEGDLVIVRRPGPLPGAADWTHQHADAANTRVSGDTLVKAPLGLLWFGGPGNQDVLPRHGHGPVPQVCQGRLFIEGPDKLRATDIYTGRLLWQVSLPGLGRVYDNTSHQPGANAAGTNYLSTPDSVYVAYRDRCLRLDAETGREVGRFTLPRLAGEKKDPAWAWLGVSGDYLIGGATPGFDERAVPGRKSKLLFRGVETAKRLTVLDRRSGAVLWQTTAANGYRHNAICIGGGRLYVIDREALDPTRKPDKKEKVVAKPGRVRAFDLATGRPLWSADRGVFGTWLSYSARHDVLVEAGLCARDTLWDEPPGMRAYRAADGKELWFRKDYFGPALIHGDRILKGGDARAGSGTACDLLTGQPIQRRDPLTGEMAEWKWVRTYGCNTPAASQHLVCFRSGAAGFFDLANDGGTGNLGGFRSSCTMNMIVAGGVLTVPDYTRTCTCTYQNQTSVGLVHMPEGELWTFTTARSVKGTVRQVGVNLAAPGSRKADNGTLWLEHPPAGGPSPKLTVRTKPAAPEAFRLHASQVDGDGLKWVAASGLRGLRELRVTLAAAAAAPRRYTVRLTFLEPDRLPPGRRRFDVALQGKVVLPGLDVSREAGGPGRALVREFKGVRVDRDLTVTLTPAADAAVRAAVLSGVEVLPEGW